LNILVTATTAQAQAQLAAVNSQMKTMAAQAGISGGALGKIGKGAGAGIAAVGATAAIATKKLYDLGEQFEDSYDKIRVGTGATGRELRRLEKDFKSVLTRTPAGMDEVSDAITDLNTRLGLSDKPLRAMAYNMVELSRLTGDDLKGNIKSVARAFVDWEVPVRKQTDALNGLYRLSQESGASVSEIADNIQKFGSPLRTLGIDIDYAAAMFANFERAGVNMQTMVPGLKLAIGNMTDPTGDLAQKFDELGVSANDLPGGLQKVFAALSKQSDLSNIEKRSLAMDVFGKRAGADMLEAVSQGRFEIDKFMDTFNDSRGDSIPKTSEELRGFAENISIFADRVKVQLEPAARDVVRVIDDLSAALVSPEADKGRGFIAKNWEIALWPVKNLAKQVKKLTDDLADESSQSLAQLRESTAKAVAVLADSGQRMIKLRGRLRNATDKERAAEQALREARQKHGSGSGIVVAAEIRLHRAKQKTLRLTEAVKNAERLHGVEREIASTRLQQSAAAEKARIGRLNRYIAAKKKQRDIEWRANGDSERLRELEGEIAAANKKRSGSQRRLNATLEDAAKSIGPKFARSLKDMSAKTATIANALGTLRKRTEGVGSGWKNALPPLKTFGDVSQNTFKRVQVSMEDYAAATGRKRTTVNENMRAMPPVQRAATSTMMELFRNAMDSLDDGGTPRQSRRGGGVIERMFQKYGGGGMVPAAVSPGEMIAYGDKVGVVPGRPTARDSVHMDLPVGAKVFTFDGQRKLAQGASESEALRKQRPHFNAGGIVKPVIEGGSTKARAVANKAIGNIHSRAVEKYQNRKERLAAMAASSGNFNYTGPPADFRQLGDNSWVDSHTLAVGAYLVNRFGVGITDGWRPQDAGYGAVNSSHKRGTPSNPGALDFAPPNSAMQAFIGKHIAGITENDIHDWGSGLHNHVAFFNKGGLVGKAKSTLSYAKDVRKEAKNSKLARQAVKAAIRAVGFAKDGKSGMAEKFTERAQKLSSRAAQSIPGLSSGRPGLATNRFDQGKPFSPTNLPGFSFLPKQAQDLMMSPGLSAAARQNLANMALTLAGDTATKTDDAAALNVILRLQTNQKSKAQRNLRKANAMLAKGGLTKKQRQRWMGVRDRSLETIASTTGEIISTRGSINELNGGDGETSMADAMKELADAIKEQNRLQSGVQAVGSREALRMLSDVISGEIVGKRSAPVNSYSGVRY
jgi:TP901 family phage tail tape measure protein